MNTSRCAHQPQSGPSDGGLVRPHGSGEEYRAAGRHHRDRAVPAARDIRFVIAGDGPDRSILKDLIDRSRGRVEWLGWQLEILPAMARCDVLLQTSRNEGTPVALIQGMAAARPFVSTAVGGVVDMVSGMRPIARPAALWYSNAC